VKTRSRWHLRTAFGWGLSLAVLVLASSVLTEAFRGAPGFLGLTVVIVAFTAAAAGVFLNWRVSRERSAALRDPLTGLPNRVLLDDRMEQALRRSHRTGEPFTVIVVDLDGFKAVNDVRGHHAGDTVLRTLARRFEAIVRELDTVARVGGDEFVILSLATGGDQDASALVGRLRHALRRPFSVDGAVVEIDGSLGWATYPKDGATAVELLAGADSQMYATKRDASDDTAPPRLTIDAGVVRDIEVALERDELVVLYQPILELPAGAPRSAEALVRRFAADGSLVLPADFLPHVERTPVAREVALRVVGEALQAVELWSSAGHELGVSVNVPYRLLEDAQFADGLAAAVRDTDLTTTTLTLEVIPAGPGAGAELDRAVLERLRALGVRLSLDDVGRAASFAALRLLPLDEMKIDASFLRGLGRSATDRALVQGMIGIGHALGLAVVAEGVETREAWQAVAAWGCDLAQGFYVATPRSADELLRWLGGRWPAVA